MYLRATVQDGVSGFKQAAAKFLLPMHKYGRLTFDPFPYLISLFADTGTDVNAEKN
jgi:hypothetical protein